MSIVRYEVKDQFGRKADFGRIVCGIGWPAEQPGYAVFIGEEKFPAVGTRVYHAHLLTELVDVLDAAELIRKCARLAAEYGVQVVSGRRHQPMIQLLNVLNAGAHDRHMPELRVVGEPHSENGGLIEFHLNLIRDRLSPNSKTLHGVEGTRLAAHLAECSVDKVHTATDLEYPAIAALGYAVEELALYPTDPNYDPEDECDPDDYRPRSKQCGY
jgi:hypothetical protein